MMFKRVILSTMIHFIFLPLTFAAEGAATDTGWWSMAPLKERRSDVKESRIRKTLQLKGFKNISAINWTINHDDRQDIFPTKGLYEYDVPSENKYKMLVSFKYNGENTRCFIDPRLNREDADYLSCEEYEIPKFPIVGAYWVSASQAICVTYFGQSEENYPINTPTVGDLRSVIENAGEDIDYAQNQVHFYLKLSGSSEGVLQTLDDLDDDIRPGEGFVSQSCGSLDNMVILLRQNVYPPVPKAI